MTVANDFNPIQKIATEKLDIPDWWFIPPEHVNYFNPESITRLLEQSGYEILDISTTFPIDIFLLMGDNYVSDPKIGKKSHLRRKEFEFTLSKTGREDFKNNLYKSFKNLGIGREIEILATPKI